MSFRAKNEREIPKTVACRQPSGGISRRKLLDLYLLYEVLLNFAGEVLLNFAGEVR